MLRLTDYVKFVEQDGCTQEIVGYWNLPGRKKKKTKYSYQNWSFQLKDGRYAYWDYDNHDKKKMEFYHVVTINDPDLLNYLDYCDRQEANGNRRLQDHESYKQLNHMSKIQDNDEDGVSRDPVELEMYHEWIRDEDTSKTSPFPVDAEKGIIQCIVQQLPPAERGIYGLLYDSYLSQIQIKKELNISHSTWSMRKKRFLEDVKKAFIALGYDVTEFVEEIQPEEKEKEAEAYRTRLKKDYELQKEEEEMRQLGKSIMKERWYWESPKTHDDPEYWGE